MSSFQISKVRRHHAEENEFSSEISPGSPRKGVLLFRCQRAPRSRTTAKLLKTFEAVFHFGSRPPNSAVDLLFQEVAIALVVFFTAFLTPRGYVLSNLDQFRRE